MVDFRRRIYIEGEVREHLRWLKEEIIPNETCPRKREVLSIWARVLLRGPRDLHKPARGLFHLSWWPRLKDRGGFTWRAWFCKHTKDSRVLLGEPSSVVGTSTPGDDPFTKVRLRHGRWHPFGEAAVKSYFKA